MISYHQIALACIPGIGGITGRALVSHFGSAEDVFQAKKKHLVSIPGIGIKTAEAILNKDGFNRAEQEIKFIEKYNIQALFFTDQNFPKRLKQCYDAPVLLYFKGCTDLNTTKVISIVGTRNATGYGKELCRQLVSDLKRHNVLVVSGLAYGIDIMTHRACLKENVPTIGVLGHGLDRIYPALHRVFAEKMLENGGLITEFPSGTNPDRENFPKRNRIIAGMADATIVVEASVKGGALITAEIANSYNRDVFAFPGNVNDEFSAGCNFLIKTNRANLISGIKDLEYILDWTENIQKKEYQQISLKLNLSEDEKKVTDILEEKGVTGIDELAFAVKLPQSKLAITILGLEMQGIVIALPGKMYKLA
jgi:DNA processing protein